MSEPDGRSYIRGGGNASGHRGVIAWRLGERAGAVELVKGKVSAAPGPPGEPPEGWSYEVTWDTDPLHDAGVFRHVAIQAPEEATIVASSTGAPAIEGHGLERTEGILRTDDVATPFEEALLSTQYDGAGDPTRIGLELWPEEPEHSNRAGPTRVAGSLLGGARSGDVWAGFFRCYTDGAEGLGCYLLWRA